MTHPEITLRPVFGGLEVVLPSDEPIGCVFDHTSDGWGWSALSRYGGMADVRYRMPSRDDAIRHLATMARAAPSDKEPA